MKTTILFCIALLCFLTVRAQEENQVPKPFPIDEKYLSGLDIPKFELKAHPEREYFQKRLYRGSELTVFILSSETADNAFESFPLEEFVYFLNGRADVTPKNEAQISFYPNDYIFVPKGFAGKSTNNGGNTYHLELSVISNRRTDSTQLSKPQKPFVLDKELLAGIGLTQISETLYRDELYSGVELQIITESEEATEKQISNSPKEQFIQVLNGKVTLTPTGAAPQTFYAGDFFILPKGFNGLWQSEGANLCRTLRVMQVEPLL